jgi:hypothetical protein
VSTPEKPVKPSPGAALYFANLVAEARAERIASLPPDELPCDEPPSLEELLEGARAKAATRATRREGPGASKVVRIDQRPRRRALWWALAAAAILVLALAASMTRKNTGAHPPPPPPDAPEQAP